MNVNLHKISIQVTVYRYIYLYKVLFNVCKVLYRHLRLSGVSYALK